MQTLSERLYRLDSFIVPNHARDEFLGRVRETHAFLNVQPGFIQDFLLEQPPEGNAFRLVTLVEWGSEASIENARVAVKALHERATFSPEDFFERLGVHPELGTYRSVR